MVAADGRDHGKARRKDVGRVEPSAQTHLDHGHVDSRGREVIEPERRRGLEEGGLLILEPGPPSLQERLQRLVLDLVPLDSDPLVEAKEVGGGVEARLESRGPETRIQVRRRGALAVRSRDQDRGEGAIRAPRRLEQALDPDEAGAHPGPLEAVHLIEAPRQGGARRRLHSRMGISRSAGNAVEPPGVDPGVSLGASAGVSPDGAAGTPFGP